MAKSVYRDCRVEKEVSLTAMDQTSAVNVCYGLNYLNSNVSCNWKLKHVGVSSVLRVPETASRKCGDEAWMGSNGARDAEMVQDRKNASLPIMLRSMRLTGKIPYDIHFPLVWICYSNFDSDIFRCDFIAGKPDRWSRIRRIRVYVQRNIDWRDGHRYQSDDSHLGYSHTGFQRPLLEDTRLARMTLLLFECSVDLCLKKRSKDVARAKKRV